MAEPTTQLTCPLIPWADKQPTILTRTFRAENFSVIRVQVQGLAEGSVRWNKHIDFPLDVKMPDVRAAIEELSVEGRYYLELLVNEV